MLSGYLNWRYLFLLLSLIIIATSIYITRVISQRLQISERNNVEIWARSTMNLYNMDIKDDPALELLLDIVQSNDNIPVILTNQNKDILAIKNIDTLGLSNPDAYLQVKLKSYSEMHQPLELIANISDHKVVNYVYYGQSYLLRILRYFPYFILGSVFFILAMVLFLLNNEYKSTQNKLWLGMSKETAHQLGTPLTSLESWIHLLAEEKPESEEYREMQKDVDRLKLVVERFSKIGSKPQLTESNIVDIISDMLDYMRLRSPRKVNIGLETSSSNIIGAVDPMLFSWVIENLVKNALDVLPGKGNIDISINETPQNIMIAVKDDGAGISPENISKIFKPGFTTKKRGWGLGLSLTRRIIEDFHNGKISVKSSQHGKGTTFLINLKKQSTEDIRKK